MIQCIVLVVGPLPPYVHLASTWRHLCDECSQAFPACIIVNANGAGLGTRIDGTHSTKIVAASAIEALTYQATVENSHWLKLCTTTTKCEWNTTELNKIIMNTMQTSETILAQLIMHDSVFLNLGRNVTCKKRCQTTIFDIQQFSVDQPSPQPLPQSSFSTQGMYLYTQVHTCLSMHTQHIHTHQFLLRTVSFVAGFHSSMCNGTYP